MRILPQNKCLAEPRISFWPIIYFPKTSYDDYFVNMLIINWVICTFWYREPELQKWLKISLSLQ
jgi:hypothetical protein